VLIVFVNLEAGMEGNSLRDDGDGVDDNSNTSNLDTDNSALPGTIPEKSGALLLGELTSHVETATEAPILNKDGTIRKKPGRKPGQKTGMAASEIPNGEGAQTATLSPTKPKTPQEKKSVRLGCDQTARAILGTTVGAMRELVGPEWDFSSQEEADGMRIALAAFIEAKGGGEMSPELALLLVTCGYAGPRFAHENTRAKIGGFFKSCYNAIRDVFKR
jgi:hypothetical protein